MRNERFQPLLLDFGRALGVECAASHMDASVTWHMPDARLIFIPEGDAVSVTAATPEFTATWGTLTRAELERARRGEQAAAPAQAPRHLQLAVLSNEPACAGHQLIRLALPADAAIDPRPGQFFHVICDPEDGDGPRVPLTLRRPFSLHGITYAGFDRRLLALRLPAPLRAALARPPAEIDFLYKILGAGTRALTRVRPGPSLDVLGPLGNGFDLRGTGGTAVLIAGGIGAAPLVALAEALRFRDVRVHLYIGALTHDYLGAAVCRPDQCFDRTATDDSPEFARLIAEECAEIGISPGDVHLCTDDGSAGAHGVVTEVLERHLREGKLPRESMMYACGPHGMLAATARIAERYGVACQVSMEERMACGVGACMACVCATVAAEGVERKRVCKDGPVFSAREIVW